jgi:phosphohistidine phosphatase
MCQSRRVRRLWLLRHAKSSWDDPELPDRLRPLTRRGRKATEGLARYLEANTVAPQVVLCSPAVRATETWDGIRGALPAETHVDIDEAIYAADAPALLQRLRRVPAAVDSLLVIGHNPALGDLAHHLAGDGDLAMRQRLAAKYPTGALAGLRVPAPWHNLRWGEATLDTYVVPGDL